MHSKQQKNKTVKKSQTSLREGDKVKITLPELHKDPINIPYFVAALNGFVNEDEIDPETGTRLPCLKTLFTKHPPRAEMRQYFIPCLLALATQLHRKIPDQYAVIKFLTEQGMETRDMLLSHHSDISNRNFFSETLKPMIEGGADPGTNVGGYSVLHAVVISKNHFDFENCIDFLLEQGADPNMRETARGMGTMLHMCLANEIFSDKQAHAKVRYLVKKLAAGGYGYDWNSQDGENKTLLIMAAKMRSTVVLQALMDVRGIYGIHLDLNRQDNHGRTALHYCAALGNAEGAELLVNAGASVTVRDRQGRDAFYYTLPDEAFSRHVLQEIHIDPDRDEYALHNHLIDLKGAPVSVELAMENKTIVLKADKFHSDAFGKMLIENLEGCHYALKEYREYDLNYMRIQLQFSGRSLIEACLVGQKAVRDFFEQTMKNQFSHVGARDSLFGRTDPFERLLRKINAHLRTNPRDKIFLEIIESGNFSKALRMACNAGRCSLVMSVLTYLKEAKSLSAVDCINEVPENGKNALHFAARYASRTGDQAIVDLLLEYNPDLTIRDNEDKLYSDYLPAPAMRPH